MLYHFADGALPAGGIRYIIGVLLNRLDGVGDCDAEAGVADDGQIGQVVADIGDILRQQPELVKEVRS